MYYKCRAVDAKDTNYLDCSQSVILFVDGSTLQQAAVAYKTLHQAMFIYIYRTEGALRVNETPSKK